ncbi:MAG: hypothetical protein UE295_06800 [Acutalibacteraceae bacterium]|nr:hypothetical protein [Acutalibacteraceae bacterium]
MKNILSENKSMSLMTETEQKCYMINCLADIKNAVNEIGGQLTDETPISMYADEILSLGSTDGNEAGSFDESTQTLTLNNAFVVDGINNMTDEQTKASLLQIIGNDDLEISLENVVDYGGGMEAFASDLTITEGASFGNIITTSGGSYNIIFGAGVMIVNSDYLTLAGATLDSFTQMGGYVSDVTLTISGSEGNYEVSFS